MEIIGVRIQSSRIAWAPRLDFWKYSGVQTNVLTKRWRRSNFYDHCGHNSHGPLSSATRTGQRQFEFRPAPSLCKYVRLDPRILPEIEPRGPCDSRRLDSHAYYLHRFRV